jgi:hypothetical protein
MDNVDHHGRHQPDCGRHGRASDHDQDELDHSGTDYTEGRHEQTGGEDRQPGRHH